MRCKPGDLAYIVSSDDPASIGAIVQVVRACPLWTGVTGVQHWWVCGTRPLSTIGGDLVAEGAIEDFRLRPISGVPVDEEENAEVPA